MNIKLSARIEFLVPVTAENVAILTELSKYHYDAKCKQATTGFLANWKSYTEAWDHYDTAPNERYVIAQWDELDTCMKLMEMAYCFQSSEINATCAALRLSFTRAFTLASIKYREWQAVST